MEEEASELMRTGFCLAWLTLIGYITIGHLPMPLGWFLILLLAATWATIALRILRFLKRK